jgi:hypothetical protein
MDGKILLKEKVLDIIGGLIDFHLILLIKMSIEVLKIF